MESILKYTAVSGCVPMTAPSDDAGVDLLERCKSGDKAAFEALFHLYEKKVFRWVYRILQNAATAEDVLQETFIALFKNIRTFRSESCIDTYLYKIAANLCYRKLNKQKREAESGHISSEERRDENAGNEFEDAVNKIHVDRAVSELSLDHRVVLSLRYMDNFSVDEIAGILSISEGTVKSRLHYARLELKRRLQ